MVLEVVADEEVTLVQQPAELLQQFQRKLDPVLLPVGRADLRQRMPAIEELKRVGRFGLQAQDLVADVLGVADAEGLSPLFSGNREHVDIAKLGAHEGVFVVHGNRL